MWQTLGGWAWACQHTAMKNVALIFPVLLLSACSTGISTQKYNDHPGKSDDFMLCHGYSCTHQSQGGFTEAQWRKVGAIFKKPSKNAVAERGKIATAIAMMERFSGVKTGTNIDDAEAVGLKTGPKQMDCIDETVNTTAYIGFLQKEGWLKFHQGTEPTHRGYIFDGTWPHNTAVIREIKTGDLWAVDSFYRKNGEAPYIVPRADWLKGWKPPGATQ